MTMRLSASSLAGTARTLVAVGTVSEAFMFLTTLAAAPRSGICLAPAAGAFAAGLAAGLAADLAALPTLGFAAGAGWLFSGCAFRGWGCFGGGGPRRGGRGRRLALLRLRLLWLGLLRRLRLRLGLLRLRGLVRARVSGRRAGRGGGVR